MSYLCMVKLICYNIEYCTGIQGSWLQYFLFWKLLRQKVDEKILEALNELNPDILALVEVDTGSFRAG